MFDINAIINNAIATAVAEAIKPLVARIEALENIAAEYTPAPAVTIDEAKMVEALNSQEWFWDKLIYKAKEVADVAVERAMEEHTEEYNHDSYDDAISKVEDIDFDELVKTDYLSEAVRDAVQDLSFEIRVR